jgi:hypothetical protein
MYETVQSGGIAMLDHLIDLLTSLDPSSAATVTDGMHHVLANVTPDPSGVSGSLLVIDPATHLSHVLQPGFNHDLVETSSGHVTGFIHHGLNGDVIQSVDQFGTPNIMATHVGSVMDVANNSGQHLGTVTFNPFDNSENFDPFI